MISILWDKLDPGFLAPIWLLVGFVAVIAVALLEFGAWRRRRQAVRMFAASHLVATLAASVSPVKRVLKTTLLLAAVALLFAALARPHLFYDWQDENRTGLDILFAVDCSKSMLTDDVRPSRIERAKLAIADFAERVPENRLGLIAFAGDAFLQCPLTLDHDAFQTAVRELDTDTIPRPGTDIATAIDAAVDATRSQPNNLKLLVLVTDGEDLEGRAIDAAKNAAQAGLKIYTIGVGTLAGDVIRERDEYGAMVDHRDANGQDVVSRLDENTLRQIADVTGGAYVPLGQRGEGLATIYDRYIAPLPKQDFEERREKIRIERFEWPLAAAILFLMAEFLINDRAAPARETQPPLPVRKLRRRRGARPDATVAVPLLIVGLFLGGHANASPTSTAEHDYKSQKYEEAMQNYAKAAESSEDAQELQYNRGDAAYKAGEFSEAEDAFRQALETPDLKLQEKTYFNLGNTQFQHGVAMQKVDADKTMGLWQQALHSYDSAMKLHPSADTQHNYDYVKQRLEELKKQQQGKGKKKGQSGKNSNDPSDGSSQDGKGQAGQNDSQDGQGSQQQPGGDQQKEKEKVKTYSDKREQDQQDPGIRSKQDAENLLDSLKDDERHVNARRLNGDNQPPPPRSGKDW